MQSTHFFAISVSARYIILAALALLIAVSLVLISKAAEFETRRTRSDVISQLAEAQEALKEHPEETKNRQNTARLLYESGDFWRATETIQPLLNDGKASPEALALAAELEYLLGHYEKAERLYEMILAQSEVDQSGRIKAKVGLIMIYYQTNRFDRAKEIDLPRGAKLPHWDVMKSFEQAPYRLEWSGEKMTQVPFVATDPAPLLTVEYNGTPVHVLFDTGADMCIVDTDVAKEMGIKQITSAVGAFGGGKLARIGFGKLESVKIGSVMLNGVPVMILPTKRFSKAIGGGKFPMGGIIGTGLIRQFLTTIDYANEKMVLRERSHKASKALRKQLQGRIADEVPFVLSVTHLMMARGSINGRDGLTFFVDSGLASEARLAAPLQTLRYLGISEPERKVDPTSVGGGGGVWASALFSIDALGLGSLRQKDVKGEYGSRPASSYWERGFIQDGLISHGFLRQYASWTIDFDRFKYVLTTERP